MMKHSYSTRLSRKSCPLNGGTDRGDNDVMRWLTCLVIWVDGVNARSAVGGCWNVAERETLSQPNQEEQDKKNRTKRRSIILTLIRSNVLLLSGWMLRLTEMIHEKHENAQSHRLNEKENEKGQRPESSCTRWRSVEWMDGLKKNLETISCCGNHRREHFAGSCRLFSNGIVSFVLSGSFSSHPSCWIWSPEGWPASRNDTAIRLIRDEVAAYCADEVAAQPTSDRWHCCEPSMFGTLDLGNGRNPPISWPSWIINSND